MRCAEQWITHNNLILDAFQTLDVTLSIDADLQNDQWYLVICNHQSWTDILLLQRALNRKIPMLKFFIKQALIYVPILGICWWALDFPIMKRYSRQTLIRKPQLKGKDLETTRKSCERFKLTPVAVLNFLEGTRFTVEKQRQSNSPYQRLLKPKTAGAAMVVEALEQHLTAILDVTIVYHQKTPNFFDFLSGHPHPISIKIEQIAVPKAQKKSEQTPPKSVGRAMQQVITDRWALKDAYLQQSLEPN
jgi:1-acyl-sn-glycerol-3-phosphate acyltransferase